MTFNDLLITAPKIIFEQSESTITGTFHSGNDDVVAFITASL